MEIIGLAKDIQKRMTEHHQRNVIKAITSAASKGESKCTINKKGVTPDFIEALSDEGLEIIVADTEITLYWEYE